MRGRDQKVLKIQRTSGSMNHNFIRDLEHQRTRGHKERLRNKEREETESMRDRGPKKKKKD
jgi:hypothetical protein